MQDFILNNLFKYYLLCSKFIFGLVRYRRDCCVKKQKGDKGLIEMDPVLLQCELASVGHYVN